MFIQLLCQSPHTTNLCFNLNMLQKKLSISKSHILGYFYIYLKLNLPQQSSRIVKVNAKRSHDT